MQIKRRFPRTDITYSRKQMLEFNILIMQALFPEAFTEKERKILVELCQNLGPNEPITKTLKWRIMELTNVEEMNTLNTFLRNIAMKQGLLYTTKSKRQLIINPVLYLAEDVTELNININLKRHDHTVPTVGQEVSTEAPEA
jgi:prophage tail gpP-like protein